MKIAIAKEHRDFYKKNGWIQLEEIFTQDQLFAMNRAIDQTLGEKLKIPSEKIFAAPTENAFQQGRDLWRHNEILRKTVCSPRLAEVVSELIEIKPLRIAYDQYLPPIPLHKAAQCPLYSKFLQEQLDFESMCCIKGVLAGLLVCLTAAPEQSSESEEVDIFPSLVGHVTIFNPQTPFNFAKLTAHSHQRFYLIVYTQNSSYYASQPNDPHTHYLKKLGYVYNDRLSDKFNPIVYR